MKNAQAVCPPRDKPSKFKFVFSLLLIVTLEGQAIAWPRRSVPIDPDLKHLMEYDQLRDVQPLILGFLSVHELFYFYERATKDHQRFLQKCTFPKTIIRLPASKFWRLNELKTFFGADGPFSCSNAILVGDMKSPRSVKIAYNSIDSVKSFMNLMVKLAEVNPDHPALGNMLGEESRVSLFSPLPEDSPESEEFHKHIRTLIQRAHKNGYEISKRLLDQQFIWDGDRKESILQVLNRTGKVLSDENLLWVLVADQTALRQLTENDLKIDTTHYNLRHNRGGIARALLLETLELAIGAVGVFGVIHSGGLVAVIGAPILMAGGLAIFHGISFGAYESILALPFRPFIRMFYRMKSRKFRKFMNQCLRESSHLEDSEAECLAQDPVIRRILSNMQILELSE